MAQDKKQEPKKNLWYYRKEIGVGIILIISALFMIQNSQEVRFWFFSSMEVRLIFILIIFFLLGALTVWLYHFINSRDKKKEIKRLKKEMSELKTEVQKAYQQVKEGVKDAVPEKEESKKDGKKD